MRKRQPGLPGHMPGGNRNPDDTKSVFYGVTAAQMMKIVQEAYNNSSKIATIGDRIKLQGYSSIYGKVIELWINISDYILETAYPIN